MEEDKQEFLKKLEEGIILSIAKDEKYDGEYLWRFVKTLVDKAYEQVYEEHYRLLENLRERLCIKDQAVIDHLTFEDRF